MQSNRKLYFAAVSLAIAIAACGAAPTVTPTSAPPPTATVTIAQPAAASATATSAPATATRAVTAPTATTAPALPPTPTRPITSATATPAAPAPVGNTPDAIANAQRAVLKQKAFRLRATITSNPGTPMSNVVEYVLPDRVHMTIGGTAGTEMIIIKDVGFWQRIGGGQWQSLPAAQAASAAIFAALDPGQIDSMMQEMVVDKFKSLGVETLDGRQMRTYEYVTRSTTSGVTIDTTQKIWIGVADGLPYKSESASTNSATPGVTSQTTSLYEYDSNIKIEAPM